MVGELKIRIGSGTEGRLMLVRSAKDVARRWVTEEAVEIEGVYGVFLHGSINWLSDDTVLPMHSDVDVMVVLEGSDSPLKLGKFIYHDVLLEVSYLSRDEIKSPEMILGQYHLAGSFQGPSILLDPSGQLTRLQRAVARDYAKRQWVFKRCQHARNKILYGYKRLDEVEAFHDQVLAWLFPTGVTTHVLLVAGLENPTVRKRYLKVRSLLADYGYTDFYELLLELLGCAQMKREEVEDHLMALTEVFDAAKMVIRTPFPFSSDISDLARPIAIDGSWEMIRSGFHREAVFWIAATYSRCQKVLYHDGPAKMHDWASKGYYHLLSDLGIRSSADLKQRREQVKDLLPQVWEVAEAIMADNPAIED